MRVVKNGLLVLFGLLFGVALAEVGVRLFVPVGFSADPVLYTGSFLYLPNQKTRFRGLEWDVELTINSQGFRDHEPEEMVAPVKVAAIGDSFTEGYNVELDETWVKQLEESLQGKGYEVDVLNTGHSSYDLRHYLRLYHEHVAHREEIKLVVVALTFNDFISGETDPVLHGCAICTNNDRPFSYRIKSFLGRHSALYNLVNRVIKTNYELYRALIRLGIFRNLPQSDIEQWYVANEKSQIEVDYSLNALRKLAGNAQEDGKELVVFIVPPKTTVEDELWNWAHDSYLVGKHFERLRLNKIIGRYFDQAGVHFYDPTEMLIKHAREREEELYFKSDGHWNREGHRLSAEGLSRYLEETELTSLLKR